jgi:hypothetical protein
MSMEKRQRPFNRFSGQITLYEPAKEGLFFCPLCMRAFTEDALEGPDPYLSLAHVIPKRFGGRLCTLTCKPCNNLLGEEKESALFDRLIAEDRSAGFGRVPARMTGPFGEIGIDLQFPSDGRTWSMHEVRERSNPAHLEALHAYLNDLSGGQPREFNFTTTIRYDHRPRQAEAALYQSAYLLMFSYFGYEFVTHSHFAELRERVLHPEESGWKTRIIIPGDDVLAGFMLTRSYAVMFVCQPSAVLVFLRLHPKTGRDRVLAVVLAGLDTPLLPAGKWERFKGCIAPYSPDQVLKTKFYMRKLWLFTHRGEGLNREPLATTQGARGPGGLQPGAMLSRLRLDSPECLNVERTAIM